MGILTITVKKIEASDDTKSGTTRGEEVNNHKEALKLITFILYYAYYNTFEEPLNEHLYKQILDVQSEKSSMSFAVTLGEMLKAMNKQSERIEEDSKEAKNTEETTNHEKNRHVISELSRMMAEELEGDLFERLHSGVIRKANTRLKDQVVKQIREAAENGINSDINSLDGEPGETRYPILTQKNYEELSELHKKLNREKYVYIILALKTISANVEGYNNNLLYKLTLLNEYHLTKNSISPDPQKLYEEANLAYIKKTRIQAGSSFSKPYLITINLTKDYLGVSVNKTGFIDGLIPTGLFAKAESKKGHFGVSVDNAGFIANLDPDGVFAKAGLKVDDRLVSFDNIKDVKELTDKIRTNTKDIVKVSIVLKGNNVSANTMLEMKRTLFGARKTRDDIAKMRAGPLYNGFSNNIIVEFIKPRTEHKDSLNCDITINNNGIITKLPDTSILRSCGLLIGDKVETPTNNDDLTSHLNSITDNEEGELRVQVISSQAAVEAEKAAAEKAAAEKAAEEKAAEEKAAEEKAAEEKAAEEKRAREAAEEKAAEEKAAEEKRAREAAEKAAAEKAAAEKAAEEKRAREAAEKAAAEKAAEEKRAREAAEEKRAREAAEKAAAEKAAVEKAAAERAAAERAAAERAASERVAALAVHLRRLAAERVVADKAAADKAAADEKTRREAEEKAKAEEARVAAEAVAAKAKAEAERLEAERVAVPRSAATKEGPTRRRQIATMVAAVATAWKEAERAAADKEKVDKEKVDEEAGLVSSMIEAIRHAIQSSNLAELTASGVASTTGLLEIARKKNPTNQTVKQVEERTRDQMIAEEKVKEAKLMEREAVAAVKKARYNVEKAALGRRRRLDDQVAKLNEVLDKVEAVGKTVSLLVVDDGEMTKSIDLLTSQVLRARIALTEAQEKARVADEAVLEHINAEEEKMSPKALRPWAEREATEKATLAKQNMVEARETAQQKYKYATKVVHAVYENVVKLTN